jgi:hypothetical protein
MPQVVIESAVFFYSVTDILRGANYLSLRAGGDKLHELMPYYIEYNFINIYFVGIYNLFLFCVSKKSF